LYCVYPKASQRCGFYSILDQREAVKQSNPKISDNVQDE